MWLYRITTGELFRRVTAEGYSGHGEGVNQPDLQDVKKVGPIPFGKWTIGPARDDTGHGPVVMTLTPGEDTETYGRSGFLIHGDLVGHVGEHLASEGCIILPRMVREQIAASGDHDLVVEE